MTCDEARQFIHAYVDGELDVIRTVDVERHLQGCVACRAAFESLQSLRDAVRAGAPRFEPPAGFEARVVSAVRREATPGLWPKVRARAPWLRLAAPGGFAAGFAVAALVFLIIVPSLRTGAPQLGVGAPSGLRDEVVSSHVRSLLGRHLFDVASTDQHTVKPWFEGKLNYAPAVADLSAQGFPLLGGRLDYVGDRPVAALVYRRRRHVINLFQWPGGDRAASPSPESYSVRGFHAVHWSRGGMEYYAVSDVDPVDLMAFSRALGGR